MKTEEEKDKIIAKWLEGKLSGEELSAFEASEAFKEYQAIVDGVDKIQFPQMDEALVFQNIRNEISAKENYGKSDAKIIPLKRWIMGVAAIAILSLAAMFVFQQPIKVSSDIGQFVSQELPDGSEVELNGNSEITYKKNFIEDRTLHLEGEAFFNVEHGEKFEVQTDEGSVSVLGTSFNVFARDDIFIVSCKTGKVKVEAENQEFILEKGESVSVEKGKSDGKKETDIEKIGKWSEGVSYFSNTSLETIALALESTYNVDVNLPTSFENRRITGSFVHDDIEKALKMVFSPMRIKYSIDDLGKVNFEE